MNDKETQPNPEEEEPTSELVPDDDIEGAVDAEPVDEVLLPDDSGAFVETMPDDVDIAAALASLGELDILAGVEQPEPLADDEPVEQPEPLDDQPVDEALIPVEDEPEPVEAEEPREPAAPLARPPLMKLQRGQLASVVPALLLIAAGIWLTLTLTSGGDSVEPVTLLVLGVGAFGLMLLAQWQSSAYWSRGSFFVGALVIVCGGVMYGLLQPGSIGLARGWPLVITAAGVAFILTAILTQPFSGRLILIGLMVGAAGVAAFALTAGVLSASIAETLTTAWPVILVLVILVLALPLLVGRGGRN